MDYLLFGIKRNPHFKVQISATEVHSNHTEDLSEEDNESCLCGQPPRDVTSLAHRWRQDNDAVNLRHRKEVFRSSLPRSHVRKLQCVSQSEENLR